MVRAAAVNPLPDRALTPEPLWQARHRLPGLWRTLAAVLRSWSANEPVPDVEPVIEENLRVMQMALDTATTLKRNGRAINGRVLGMVGTLLDVTGDRT